MFLMRRDVYFKCKDLYFNCRDVLFLSGGRHLENEMYISNTKMYIFQLVRCIIPIWQPPDISGGRHLENEMYYISSTKMYISTGEMHYSYLAATT